jgi:3-oxoacyl-[acyl-carrier protein] reductase
VAMSSRSRERIDAAAAAVGATGFVFDAGDPDAGAGLVAEVEAELGPLDVLVVNTGGPPAHPDALAHARDVWEDAYRALVLTPLALIQAALPGMRERGFGRVLNVASISVREPMPALVLSSAHRAAIAATFKTLATEVAGDGVTLNTLLPGTFATDRAFALMGGPENVEARAASIPAGRIGRPEELGAAAAFLCSVPAAFITGETLRVDGGVTRSV